MATGKPSPAQDPSAVLEDRFGGAPGGARWTEEAANPGEPAALPFRIPRQLCP
jgi:hypothetical protein